MKAAIDAIFRTFLPITGVSLAWIGLFIGNFRLIEGLSPNSFVNWIFLPAALRIIAILLFGWRGMIGLMIGAAVTFPSGEDFSLRMIGLPITSGVGPFLAVTAWRRLFGLNSELSGLRPFDLLGISISCAIANSALINIVLTISGTGRQGITKIITVIVGDLTGTALILIPIALILSRPVRPVG